MNTLLPTVAFAALGLGLLPARQAEPTSDELAVRAAVEDYVLGFYTGATERLERALAPEMNKLGFRWSGESYGEALPMTLEQALELAATRRDPARRNPDASYEITLFEVCDQTATAKLRAYWGQDYFHLAKGPDGWRIHHILWQSAPRERAE